MNPRMRILTLHSPNSFSEAKERARLGQAHEPQVGHGMNIPKGNGNAITKFPLKGLGMFWI